MPLEDQSGKVHVLKLAGLSFTDLFCERGISTNWQLFLGDALMTFRFMIYRIEQKFIKITTKNTLKKLIIQPLNSISGSFFIIYQFYFYL